MYDKYAFEGQITKHKSNTEWYWLTDSRVDYSNFNFDYDPPNWESQFIHAFGDQHSVHGGTYLVHIDHDNNTDFKFVSQTVTRNQAYDVFTDTHKIDFRSETSTEWYWVTSPYNDYVNFDFTWHPELWEKNFVHVFPDQHATHGGTYIIHKDCDLENIEYKYHDFKIQRVDYNPDYWITNSRNSYAGFDYTWHPEPWEEKYVHCFGDQHADDSRTYFVVDGVDIDNARKYYHPKSVICDRPFQRYHGIKLQNCDTDDEYYWITSDGNDYTEFDFTWHPDEWQSKYVHCFGDQYSDDAGTYLIHRDTDVNNARIQYHPNAIQRTESFEQFHVKGLQKCDTKNDWYWIVDDANDYQNFDFKWHPESWKGKYVHCFGDQHSDDANTYLVPRDCDLDNVKVEYHNHAFQRVKPWNRFKISGLKTVDSDTDWYWIISDENDYTDFDFTWHPESWQTKYVHCFGDQHADDSNTYLVHKSHDITNIRWQYHPDSVTRTAKYDIIQYDGELNHHAEANTEWYWLINKENDYTDFDFTWHPETAQRKFVHVFGDQFSETSGTYLINKALDPNDCRQQFHENKVVRKTTGTIHRCSNMMPDDDGTRLFSNLFNFIKRIANNSDERNIWVTASIVDDTDFDFKWHPADWESKYIHVFHHEQTEYGYVMWVPLDEFKKQMDTLQKLEWFDTIKYHNTNLKFHNLPINVFKSMEGAAEKIQQHTFTHHYEWFVEDSVQEQSLPNYYPARWDEVNIDCFGEHKQMMLVPREAKSFVLDQVYDYPAIASQRHDIQTQANDIIFISYDESMADEKYEQLKQKYPRAKRVHGIKGQTQAYHKAAELSNTDYFFAVFPKLDIHPEFDFEYQVDRLHNPCHWIFNSYNPVNGLKYGHEGIILFNKKLVLETTDPSIDFVMSKPHDFENIMSTTMMFNEDPWLAWRTAFREVVKLNYFNNQKPSAVTQERIDTWCTVAEGTNSEWVLQGANDGQQFFDSGQDVKLSYDFEWLREQFNSVKLD